MDSRRAHKEEDALLDAMLLSTSEIFPMVLNAAIQLDLFGIIAKEGPGAYVSANWIASKLATKNPEAPSILDRMLRLFASHSLLSYSVKSLNDGTVETVYGLTPVSQYYINGRNDERSLSPAVTLAQQPAYINAWLNLKDAILEGGDPFSRTHGMSLQEYTKKDTQLITKLNEAMAAYSTINTNAILQVYKGFDGIKSLVDVGGGTGETLNMIISKYPSIKGINFDLPPVLQNAPQSPGIQHVGGDMFVSIPNSEVIMTKGTCHNWNDENVVIMLRNIYEALPSGGKLIIISVVKPEELDTTKMSQYVSILDMKMLALLSGKQRNIKEFRALTEAAGFKNFCVACVAHSIWAVMEAFK